MSVQILNDNDLGIQALYCTTREVALSLIFRDDPEMTSAETFLRWLPVDARGFTASQLQIKKAEFLESIPALWCDDCEEFLTACGCEEE